MPVGEFRQKWPQDVLCKGYRGGEQRRARATHDGGEQCAEENHLRGQRRVFKNQIGQDVLRIGIDMAVDQGRIDQRRRVSQIHWNESENEIHATADHRTASGGFFVLRRGNTLEHVLLRNRAEAHGDPCGKESDHRARFECRQKFEFAGAGRVFNNDACAAGNVADNEGDVNHAEQNHAHLKEIGKRHREHAAGERIQQHDGSPDRHALPRFDCALGQHGEDQS